MRVCILMCALLGEPALVDAAWQLDGNSVCSANGDQWTAAIVADDAGGAIVAWPDQRADSVCIFAQRFDAHGVMQWVNDGVKLASAPLGMWPQIVSDGAGGAIVAWTAAFPNPPYYKIWMQRVNAAGVPLWGFVWGIPLCGACFLGGDQTDLVLTSDGAGGAIVVWAEGPLGDQDIWAQRVNASGVKQWGTSGVDVYNLAFDQSLPTIAPDGVGGAIVTWNDFRSGTNYDIYAQRLNAAGAKQWAPPGVSLCVIGNDQYLPVVASTGAGEAVVVWNDFRNGTDFDVYAQKVNAAGASQWSPVGGVALCTAPNKQFNVRLASDGAGGAIATWEDLRSGTNNDVYARRVNGAGVVQWMSDGVALCVESGDQNRPRIISDGIGGAIATWYDGRRLTGQGDIYAERIDGLGAPQWVENGLALCTAVPDQSRPAIAPDGSGGAFVAWEDSRSPTAYDIYAQRVSHGGMVPVGVATSTPSLSVRLGANYPNPFSNDTVLDLTLRRETAVVVEVFDTAGRRVRAIDLGRRHAGTSELRFDGRDDHAHMLASGVYFYRVHAGNETVTRKMVIIH